MDEPGATRGVTDEEVRVPLAPRRTTPPPWRRPVAPDTVRAVVFLDIVYGGAWLLVAALGSFIAFVDDMPPPVWFLVIAWAAALAYGLLAWHVRRGGRVARRCQLALSGAHILWAVVGWLVDRLYVPTGLAMVVLGFHAPHVLLLLSATSSRFFALVESQPRPPSCGRRLLSGGWPAGP